MGKDEKILLSVAFVALVALVLARWNSVSAMVSTARPSVNYRNYNAVNWSAVQSLTNIIPVSSSGSSGISNSDADVPGWNSGCNCFGV